MLLKDQVAIVTGASQGIGKAISLHFAKHGALLVINGRNNGPLDRLKKELINRGSKCVSVAGDISDINTSKRLVEEAIKNFKRIDILVNNAGIITRTPTEKMTLEEWDQVMNVNLKGTLFTCRAVMPCMKSQKYGRIINISSEIAKLKMPNLNSSPSYGTSKIGMLYLTRYFAFELASYGINVNAICPGPVETEMTKKWDPVLRENVASKIPLKRLGKPVEIANAALFLSSRMSNYITGESINVNGGNVMD